MDIVAVDGVDAESHYLGRVFWAGTGRSGEDGYILVLQLGDVVYYVLISQFGWFVLVALTAYDACNLKIGSWLECLDGELTDIAVTYYGCSKFLHCILSFICCLFSFQLQKYSFYSRKQTF